MKTFTRILSVTAVLLAPPHLLLAEAAADASGHWEGSIQMQPNVAIAVEIDLARNASGAMAGTFGQPAQGVKGLPLSTVAVDNSSVRFVVKAGPDAATFDGTLAGDGQSISGQAAQGGYSVP